MHRKIYSKEINENRLKMTINDKYLERSKLELLTSMK